MGGQQSTRKLTLDNDDPTNVIKVSDAVVERLKGKSEAVRHTGDKGASVAPPTMSVHPVSVPVGPPVTPLYPQYMYEPSQTSIQIRQERETQLRKNDAYWQSRINRLEESHGQINKIMEMEYNNAMKEVKGHFTEMPTGGRNPVCIDGKKAVMDCYKKYPNEPMRCAREVQAFAECVDKHRFNLVANRG